MTAATPLVSKVFFETFDTALQDLFGGAALHAIDAEGGSDRAHRGDAIAVPLPDLFGSGFTASLVTVDQNGWPLTALLGPGELFAADEHHLILALWPTSRAAAQLSEQGKGSLSFVLAGRFFQLHLQVDASASVDGLMFYRTSLMQGEAQAVPYATLTDGIRYTIDEPSAVFPRWREQLIALRAYAKRA